MAEETNTGTLQIENAQGHDEEVFIGFHYPELKDLCKHFLTVIAGVLAFSVTFSEKIVEFSKAQSLQKVLLISSWLLFIVAFVGVGVGLYLNLLAAANVKGAIIRGNKRDFKPIVQGAYMFLELASGLFVIGLILLAVTAASKFF